MREENIKLLKDLGLFQPLKEAIYSLEEKGICLQNYFIVHNRDDLDNIDSFYGLKVIRDNLECDTTKVYIIDSTPLKKLNTIGSLDA